MDLWTARLRANRAVLPWITTKPLPTAPPSDHNSTDPQDQDLFDGGLKGETRSLIFELIEANTLCSWFRLFFGEKVIPRHPRRPRRRRQNRAVGNVRGTLC